MARKKVADDGYVFKKGHSRSKIYGQSDILSAPKRPKYDKEAREEHIVATGEELSDISRLLAYKEKSLCQAENARSSRSVTPLCGHSYSASSPSPINVHGSEQVTSQPHSLSPASSTTLSVVSSQSSTNELKHITSPLSPQPLSPTCCGSRMNLIECTQSTKLNVILSQIALTSPGSIFSAASPWVAF